MSEAGENESWAVREFPRQPPEETDLEALAHRLLGYEDDTRKRILYALATGPKRFKELREATDKLDGQLTRALSALHDEGLLVERLNAREEPVVKTHDLSPRGEAVLDLIDRLHEAAEPEPLEVATPEQTYRLYARLDEDEDGDRVRVYFFEPEGEEPENARPSPAPPRGRVVIGRDGRPAIAQG